MFLFYCSDDDDVVWERRERRMEGGSVHARTPLTPSLAHPSAQGTGMSFPVPRGVRQYEEGVSRVRAFEPAHHPPLLFVPYHIIIAVWIVFYGPSDHVSHSL